ncbi:MAG: hypothetical protein IJG57_05265 [Firmicutes bacterium]|jgi:hypothetical protein|nr:hypothetical protein [Bacillota bacterium]
MNNDGKNSYKDIIGLPHHVSPTRKRMPLKDRAAQFAPFAALTGYGDAIQETARETTGWQDLYEDEKEYMEETLRRLASLEDRRPEAEAVYFVRDPLKDGGSFQTVSGRVRKIDTVERKLVFEDGTGVPLADLVELELV